MSDKMIMEFKIVIDRDMVSEMQTSNGMVKIIPFGGSVESDLFTGKILPGAADIQVTNAAGIRHMCARYMFEGTDSAGQQCHLFVDNNGYFERGHQPRPFDACPTFMTDSEVLAPYLHGAHFRAEGHGSELGVNIRIFDVNKEE